MSYTTGKSSQADNITMSGGGVYSLATAGAKDVIKKTRIRVSTRIQVTSAINLN